ncbi:MAG: hypothetical protein NT122_09040, partial [Solirubrobacterales bacterium]|nr:hypothetical protein [Solirubrobacterales bacterium]
LGPVTQLSQGIHTYAECAVKTNQTLACWGEPNVANIPAGVGAVRQVAVGDTHACAILDNDATAICWGDDGDGQATPPAGLGAISQITAGGDFTCAVKAIDSNVVCWGLDSDKQATVPSDLGAVKSVSAGGAHACAIKSSDSTVVCWGQNSDAQETPPADLGSVTQISLGRAHSCAIRTDQTVRCWGWDRDGQLALGGRASQISAGTWTTCKVDPTGMVICLGADFDPLSDLAFPDDVGQLKVPSDLRQSLARPVIDFGAPQPGLDFGDVRAGEKSVVLTLPITNRPTVPGAQLNIESVTLPRSSTNAFSVVSQNCTQAPLPDGATCGVRVRFLPRIWQRRDLTDALSIRVGPAFSINHFHPREDMSDVTIPGSVSYSVDLVGTAAPSASFLIDYFAADSAGSGKFDFAWTSSDAFIASFTVTQPVKSIVTVKRGKKRIRKTVTVVKPVTILKRQKFAAAPSGSFRWNGKVNGKAAAKGKWTVTITATSDRGTITRSAPIKIG